ncbi:hypothetical protein OIU77_009744, partial [Salix suchowensis]
MGYYSIDL